MHSAQAVQELEGLDTMPREPEVHKYLHSRLEAFDTDTLYELHYMMITLGKVALARRGSRGPYVRKQCCRLRDDVSLDYLHSPLRRHILARKL